MQEKVFDAFEQVDGSASRKFGGTGLGLAISQELVRRMGGRIWVESEPGTGTTFHFTIALGLQQTQRQPAAHVDASLLNDVPILVVDDNSASRQILEATVLSWGMRPTAVDGGQTALDAVDAAYRVGNPFTLVITDSMMPGMDGFELAKRLNGLTQAKHPTVIMLTGTGRRGDASRCIDLGVAAYLLKPVNEMELLYTLVKVLGEQPSVTTFGSLITRHSIREADLKLNILLAEDNPINQKVAVRILEKMGHSVVVASNGREVLQAWDPEAFQLILMDVQMPEMDGFEATRSIRDREQALGVHIPIVAMTAHALKDDRERCLEAGMDDYISKPINTRELSLLLEKMGRSMSTGV